MDEYLSSKEVSQYLKVCKSWPYVMAKRGILPYHKMGKVTRFKRSDIEAYLLESRVEKKNLN